MFLEPLFQLLQVCKKQDAAKVSPTRSRKGTFSYHVSSWSGERCSFLILDFVFQEDPLDNILQNLATQVAQTYKALTPEAFENQVNSQFLAFQKCDEKREDKGERREKRRGGRRKRRRKRRGERRGEEGEERGEEERRGEERGEGERRGKKGEERGEEGEERGEGERRGKKGEERGEEGEERGEEGEERGEEGEERGEEEKKEERRGERGGGREEREISQPYFFRFSLAHRHVMMLRAWNVVLAAMESLNDHFLASRVVLISAPTIIKMITTWRTGPLW